MGWDNLGFHFTLKVSLQISLCEEEGGTLDFLVLCQKLELMMGFGELACLIDGI